MGCTWEVHLELPALALLQYKYVLRNGQGRRPRSFLGTSNGGQRVSNLRP